MALVCMWYTKHAVTEKWIKEKPAPFGWIGSEGLGVCLGARNARLLFLNMLASVS